MKEQSFERLLIWQKSMELARHTYLLTRELPKEERYGLVSQMQRAAISIPSNIAEGQQRSTKKDFAQFLRIAAGSAAELETQVILVEKIYAIPKATDVRVYTQEVRRMISAFIKTLT